jgi:hypothetical protein
MNNYIKDKLRLKLNLVASSGKNREGVIDEKVIESLTKQIDGLGKYEIIYTGNFPTGIHKLHDNYQVEYKDGKYLLKMNNKTEILLFASQFIDFNIKEFRNIQLKKLLS